VINLFFITLSFIFLINTYSSEDRINPGTAIVMVDNLMLRSLPKRGSKALYSLKKGTLIDVLSAQKERAEVDGLSDYWYHVRYKGIKGYVFGYYISPYKNSFIISEKNGVIFFVNNNKIVNEIKYNSMDEEIKKIEKNKDAKDNAFTAEIANIIDDNLLLIKKVSGWYSSEYFVISYIIYDKKGRIIISQDGYPVLSKVASKRLVIVNKAKQVSAHEINYLNEILLINYDGKILKNFKINYRRIYEYKGFNDSFLISKNNNYYIWVTNSACIIIDLFKLQSYVVYHKLNEYHPAKYYSNLVSANESNNMLYLNFEMIEIANYKNNKKVSFVLNLGRF